MQQLAGSVPTYIAMGLAALAAVMSGGQPRLGDIDGALLWLLTAQGRALDMPQPILEEPTRFTSP